MEIMENAMLLQISFITKTYSTVEVEIKSLSEYIFPSLNLILPSFNVYSIIRLSLMNLTKINVVPNGCKSI